MAETSSPAAAAPHLGSRDRFAALRATGVIWLRLLPFIGLTLLDPVAVWILDQPLLFGTQALDLATLLLLMVLALAEFMNLFAMRNQRALGPPVEPGLHWLLRPFATRPMRFYGLALVPALLPVLLLIINGQTFPSPIVALLGTLLLAPFLTWAMVATIRHHSGRGMPLRYWPLLALPIGFCLFFLLITSDALSPLRIMAERALAEMLAARLGQGAEAMTIIVRDLLPMAMVALWASLQVSLTYGLLHARWGIPPGHPLPLSTHGIKASTFE